MNWLQRMAAAYAGAKAASLGRTYDTTSNEFVSWLGGGPTVAGPIVNKDTAQRQASVLTCVRIIRETVASLPQHILEVDRNGNTKIVEHDLGSVLFEAPNADMDAVEFEDCKTGALALTGNSYCYRNTRSDGTVSSLYPVADVEPVRDRETGEVTFKVSDRGRTETLPREKIWQVKGFGSDGLKGLSVIGLQRELLGMAMATQDFQARFFRNGATPTFLITIPKWLTSDQRKIARENVKEIWSGAENAHKAQVLEGGMTAASATMPLKDAQFMDLRKLTRSEIFGLYRIPPHMGGDLERSTNNNIEQQALEFIMYCILPYLRRNEASAERWLLPPGQQKRFRIRYNIEGLLRADSAARGALYNIFAQNGIMSRNEIRSLEGRNRVEAPGMDDYTVQTALVPIDMLRKVAEQNAKPKPEPAQLPGGNQPGKGLTIIMPPTSIKLDVDVQPPEVHTTVAAPEVRLGDMVIPVPEVIVNNPPPSMDGVKEMLGTLNEIAERMRETASADRELVLDDAGNPVGSRIKARI